MEVGSFSSFIYFHESSHLPTSTSMEASTCFHGSFYLLPWKLEVGQLP